MAPVRPHFDDLRRRYQEADWVSEYQRLWAIFNHWLFAHEGKKTDRACIEALKANNNLELWVQRVIQRSANYGPDRIGDAYGGSYMRFAADNEISRFFLAAQESPVLEPRISWPWRKGTEHRVRETHAVALTRAQFRSAYSIYAGILASEQGIIHDETFHQAFAALGVHASGCCFFRASISTGVTKTTMNFAKWALDHFRDVPSLAPLVSLADSTTPTVLAADIVETLYNLRNIAMHGSLDFLIEKDNAAARAGYDVLDSLLRDIRDTW